jgi:hypothetical protein
VSRRIVFGIVAALVVLFVVGAVMALVGTHHGEPQPAQTTRTQ